MFENFYLYLSCSSRIINASDGVNIEVQLEAIIDFCEPGQRSAMAVFRRLRSLDLFTVALNWLSVRLPRVII